VTVDDSSDDVTIICNVTADHLAIVLEFVTSGIVRNPDGDETSGLGPSLTKSLEAFGIFIGVLNLGLQDEEVSEAAEDIKVKTEDAEIDEDRLFEFDESEILPKRFQFDFRLP